MCPVYFCYRCIRFGPTELARRLPLSTVRRGMAPKWAVMTRRGCGQDASDVTVAVGVALQVCRTKDVLNHEAKAGMTDNARDWRRTVVGVAPGVVKPENPGTK